MGNEATCTATLNGKPARGKARLESETLEFRGEGLRVSIPFKEMKTVAARAGALTVRSPHGKLSLRLGGAAEKWARKIANPPSRLDKLGVRADWRASAIDVPDAAFLRELGNAIAELSIDKPLRDSDAIFFGAAAEADLARLATLKSSIKPAGAIWVIRRKGKDASPSEGFVMAAGKAAGLVDVKVVSFSPTHTAEKFVIPVRNR